MGLLVRRVILPGGAGSWLRGRRLGVCGFEGPLRLEMGPCRAAF